MKKARVLLNPSFLPRATTIFSSASPTRLLSHQMETKPSSDSSRYCYDPVLRWDPQVEDYFNKAYGADHFARISKALTRPSSYSCIRVNTVKTTSDAVIEKLRKILNESEDGSLKLVQSDGSSPISRCQISGLDYVVFVHGSGPHRIEYGSGLENPPKEVLVSRKCAEAVLRGAQVYVPGVLACTAHVEKGDAVAVCVAMEQPGDEGDWSVNMTRGTTLQGLPSDPFYCERSGLYIGMGTTMLSRAGMFRVPHGVAVDLSNRVFRLPSFHNVLEGEIFLQNLPSIVAAHALDPQKGERILDMCAAPGGKTTAIAILMNDEGEIVAADRSHNKVLDVQKLSAEMGLSCITTCKLDALKSVCLPNALSDSTTLANGDNIGSVTSHSELSSNEEMASGRSEAEKSCEETSTEQPNGGDNDSQAEIRKNKGRLRNGRGRTQSQGGRAGKSQGFPPNSFDRVLLDAPCSALGLRPRLFAGLETVISLRNHGRYQRKMLDQAVQLVRVGGILVYSTCTINPSENEAVVRYALDKYKFLSLAPQHPRIGGLGLVGRCEFPDGYVEEWLKPGEEEMVQKFDPSSELDTIGFFIAKFSVGPKD
ncbi:NOL1/NOP2/sun family protein [Raphanus sativus]|uniref:rRNA (Cytosine-C(5))-methyltransferase NOP2C isoform X2 n=1 Tax=Raphanus sativus TaxID=3726 RepID=A0A6J0KH53_RAPSA|nr:rRNA (cytosine-C(5))-methyltransferase NOP2C isoform X2 [Raphanus sativus]KAJ4871761.1 NOL1/NOP2/sun family protein [Raphanus sativus]